MLNYAGCCKCQNRAFLGEEGRVRNVSGGVEEEEEGDSGNEGGEEEEETISFKRQSNTYSACTNCSCIITY